MSTSIRNTLVSGAALLLAVATAVPVVAFAKTAVAPAHKAATHKVMARKHAVGSPHVKAIQEALDKSGAKLKVDGFMGKATEGALKAFQTKHKLKATGTADKATLKALDVK
ncbi:MAG: peptidoglycan-binding domain-containing protein [Acidiferrobacter sp.]